jgi:hypothetical protein
VPQPGDRSSGFYVEPSRCWGFVFDHNLQGAHCHEQPPFHGRWHSPMRDEKRWRGWCCSDHIVELTAVTGSDNRSGRSVGVTAASSCSSFSSYVVAERGGRSSVPTHLRHLTAASATATSARVVATGEDLASAVAETPHRTWSKLTLGPAR